METPLETARTGRLAEALGGDLSQWTYRGECIDHGECGSGTCVCGNPIRYEFTIHHPDGRAVGVGSTCVGRLHGLPPETAYQIEDAARRMAKAAQEAKKMLAVEEEHARVLRGGEQLLERYRGIPPGLRAGERLRQTTLGGRGRCWDLPTHSHQTADSLLRWCRLQIYDIERALNEPLEGMPAAPSRPPALAQTSAVETTPLDALRSIWRLLNEAAVIGGRLLPMLSEEHRETFTKAGDHLVQLRAIVNSMGKELKDKGK